jgi:hypothetical protein
MADLAQSAMDAVRDGRVTFYPARYAQDLSRLAGREARLVHRAAGVVGASDSDLVLRQLRRGPT